MIKGKSAVDLPALIKKIDHLNGKNGAIAFYYCPILNNIEEAAEGSCAD